MIVIDRSKYREEDGSISLENRLRGTLEHGFGWYGQMQAQEVVTEWLSRSLGDEHVLLRNVSLPGVSGTIPMILISPQGVRVLIPSGAKGVFRAKGEEWLRFDGRTRRFKRARPNLQAEALVKAQAVHRFLQSQGFPLPEVEAVLLFTRHRTYVDAARPRARVVLADAVDHFAANLQQFQPIMDQDDVHDIRDILLEPRRPEPESEMEPEEGQGLPLPADDMQAASPFAPLEGEQPRARRFIFSGISRRQWMLLAVMLFLELLVLGVLVMLVMSDFLF